MMFGRKFQGPGSGERGTEIQRRAAYIVQRVGVKAGLDCAACARHLAPCTSHPAPRTSHLHVAR